MRNVWAVKAGGPEAKLVLVTLVTIADLGNQINVKPTLDGLAESTGLSPEEVHRIIGGLIAAGHISGELPPLSAPPDSIFEFDTALTIVRPRGES